MRPASARRAGIARLGRRTCCSGANGGSPTRLLDCAFSEGRMTRAWKDVCPQLGARAWVDVSAQVIGEVGR